MGETPRYETWKEFKPALKQYCRDLSHEELMSVRKIKKQLKIRGIEVDHTTVFRWLREGGDEPKQVLFKTFPATEKILIRGSPVRLWTEIDKTGRLLDFNIQPWE